MGLGNPFNVVQYALITHMVAHVTNMTTDRFVWVAGDTHVYQNQWAALQKQAEQGPLTSNNARVWLNPEVSDIDRFGYDDIKVQGYTSQPRVRFPTPAV